MKLSITALVAVCVCLVFVQPAVGSDALGVYFDAAGTQRTVSGIMPAVPFDIYVVAHDVTTDITAYEFQVPLPPEIVVLSLDLPPTAVNFGTNTDLLVGLATCLSGPGPVVLAHYYVLALIPLSDAVIGLNPHVPSSFIPPSPGYAVCGDPSDLRPFQCWETGGGGEAIINPLALTPSVCPSPTDVDITVATSPPGLEINVDGGTYTAPQVFTWEVGSSHDIGVSSPQNVGGMIYEFTSWSDAGAIAHSITVPDHDQTYTADFVVTSTGGAPPLAVYFDVAGTQRTGSIPPFSLLDFYVVTHDADGDIFGYEFQVTVPPEVIVLDRAITPASGINFGSGDNFIVGTGVCVPGAGPVVLVHYTALLVSPTPDLLIELGPATPSSFSPETPGYLTCADELRPFSCWRTGEGGEGIINPVALTPSECIGAGDNEPPEITCPAPVTLECSSTGGVTTSDPLLAAFLDGATATDNVDPNPVITNDAPGLFPVGTTTTVTFTATDASGNSSSCTSDVMVEDTTPPEISVSLNREVLWPPNHKMADIVATVTTSDVCCDVMFMLTSVTSNEPDDSTGDGNTVDDIQGTDVGTPDVAFQLRSERRGGGDGRVYTIVYTATDCAGNSTSTSAEVRVPHDHAGWACASSGYAVSGDELEAGVSEFVLIVRSKPAEYGDDGNGNTVVVTEAFDATSLDVDQMYVGNVAGVIVPQRSLEVDNNSDGMADLAVFYSTRALSVLLGLPETGFGPIGLHYTSPETIDYLVPDIFALGDPVPVIPVIGMPRERAASGESMGDADAPSVTALRPAYPNPFNPTTTIPFSLVSPQRVSLQVYDARGKLVRSLKNDAMPAGLHEVVWDGRDNAGNRLATGVYFVRFVAGSYTMTRKVVMLK